MLRLIRAPCPLQLRTHLSLVKHHSSVFILQLQHTHETSPTDVAASPNRSRANNSSSSSSRNIFQPRYLSFISGNSRVSNLKTNETPYGLWKLHLNSPAAKISWIFPAVVPAQQCPQSATSTSQPNHRAPKRCCNTPSKRNLISG